MQKLCLLLGLLAIPPAGRNRSPALRGQSLIIPRRWSPARVVTARNVSTGISTEAESNSSGVYQFPFLPPAEYEVSCEMQGFKKVVRAGVVLETASTRTLDFTLEVGALTESVEVKATVPLLESETSSVGQFIERTTVMNMPLESRRTAGLVRLMGMVASSRRTRASRFRSSAWPAAAARIRCGTWTAQWFRTWRWVWRRFNSIRLRKALQEFKAEASNYSAEFGRTANGLIQMTTRSGSNAFHGAAYEFFRNQVLDTRTFFAARRRRCGTTFSAPRSAVLFCATVHSSSPTTKARAGATGRRSPTRSFRTRMKFKATFRRGAT